MSECERKAELAETAAENIDRSSIYGRIKIRDMLLEYAALLRTSAPAVVTEEMVERAAIQLMKDETGLEWTDMIDGDKAAYRNDASSILNAALTVKD